MLRIRFCLTRSQVNSVLASYRSSKPGRQMDAQRAVLFALTFLINLIGSLDAAAHRSRAVAGRLCTSARRPGVTGGDNVVPDR